MFTGGFADKLGNRFEAIWTAQKLMEVFFGEADSLRFESIDPIDHGFEFCLIRNNQKEWHQTKRWETGGNWTVRRLEREGVLTNVIDKLSSGDNNWFVFVSEAPTKGLHELPGKATLAQTLQQFDDGLSDHEREELTALNVVWKTTTSQSWLYLKRCRFEVVSEKSLDRQIRLFASVAFNNPVNTIFPILREYLESNFNRELKTEDLRKELIVGGLLIPRVQIDPTLREYVNRATQRYLESYVPFGAGGYTIPRGESKEAVDRLLETAGPNVVLLTGSAGSGKSGVVQQVVKQLNELGVSHLAFRVDRFLTAQSMQEIGQQIYGRQEDPVVTLMSFGRDHRAVLIIDQVDAVSEASGRVGPMRDVVFELIRTANASRNVRILAVCRSFDLTNDQTLRDLEQRAKVCRIEVKPLDWESEVKPLLVKRGLDVTQITSVQRTLLTLPLNLSLLFEIIEPDSTSIRFSSTSDLFRLLVDRKQRSIRVRNAEMSVSRTISALATAMSEDQLLDAPESVLDPFPNALDLLAGENLIIRNGSRIAFFHDSFFDYAFARSFVAESRGLLDFLQSDEQFLFRRTQVRQILTAYRQSGSTVRYLVELRDVLTSPNVRYHLKDGVARWLSMLDDPSEEELDIILSLDRPEEKMPLLVSMAVYPQLNWFPFLLRRGLLAKWLQSENDDRRRDALNLIRNAAKKYPAEAEKVLRNWWSSNSARGTELLQWFAWLGDVPSKELLLLLIDFIRSKPAILFKKQLFDMHAFVQWFKKDTKSAGKILLSWFETWFEVFPEEHPFKEFSLSDIGSYWLQELQKKSPESFLDAAVPVFTETINRINRTYDGHQWSDCTWLARHEGGNYGSDRFLSLICFSLIDIAKTDSEKAIIYLRRIDPSAHPAALYLFLETIASNGKELHQVLATLLDLPRILEAGPSGADWLSFAKATKAALPYLTGAEKTTVEELVLNHWVELKYAKRISHELTNGHSENEWNNRGTAIYYLNNNGYEQWCILRTIGLDYLAERVKIRLTLLEKKFQGKSVATPHQITGGLVPPPIKKESAQLMTDAQWLRAFRAYESERKLSLKNDRRHFHSGARGLAQVLQAQTKENPERFAKLLSRLTTDIAQQYSEGILLGLAESHASRETLLRAVHDAHSHPGRPYGNGICRIFQNHPNLAEDDQAFESLAWYVEHGTAATEGEAEKRRVEKDIINIDNLAHRGTTVIIREAYGDRGAAAEALGSVIWACPSRLDAGVNILRGRVAVEPLISIRCSLTRPIYSVLRHDEARAASLLRDLVVRQNGIELTPLTTNEGVNLLYYVLHGNADIGFQLLDYLLKSDTASQRLIGAFHLFREAFYDTNVATRADELMPTSDSFRKLAADAAATHLPHADYQKRAEAQLLSFFNDPIKEIRSAAAECFRNLKPDQMDSHRLLFRAFIQSKAFEEANSSIFFFLKEASDSTFEEVVLAAERIIALAEDEVKLGTVRPFREAHYLDDLIRREYSAVANHPELKRRLLNVIDKMLTFGFYGTNQILEEHERG